MLCTEKAAYQSIKSDKVRIVEYDKPAVKHLRISGSKTFAYIPEQKSTKWDALTVESIHVSYSKTLNGYRILHRDTNKITFSRTIVFDEVFGTFTKLSNFCNPNDGNMEDKPKSLNCIADIQDMYDIRNDCIGTEITEI